MAIWPRMLFKRSGSGGGLSGPASSTDNAIPRWDGTAGDKLQNSGVLIDDSDNLVLPNSAIAFVKDSGNAKVILQPSVGVQIAGDRGIEFTDAAAAGNARTSGITRSGTGVISMDGPVAGDGLAKVELGGMRFVGYTSSTGAASTTELPTDKDCAIHKNTTTGVKVLAFNDGGSIVSVALA